MDEDEFGAIYGDVQDEKKPSTPVEQPAAEVDEGDEDALFKQLYGEEAADDLEPSPRSQKQVRESGMFKFSYSREICLMSYHRPPPSLFGPTQTSLLLTPSPFLSLPFHFLHRTCTIYF